ncbi:MAG TPA: hypothetical protein VI792_02710 [Candidatus Eisenbacteria bacterium]
MPDGKSKDDKIKGAKTAFDVKGLTPKTPGYQSDGHGTITSLVGKTEIKGTIRIQTVYGPKATPGMSSGYGRGTTAEDVKNGNTSLGFHESCHREDFLTYFSKNPLPTFKGKVGMKRADFDAAANRFIKEVRDYFTRAEKDSLDRTDEVGYTLSEYRAKGPRR